MAVDAGRAKFLFLNAAVLADPAERAAYLERECGGDAELRRRVEALLAADDGGGPFVEGDAGGRSGPTPPATVEATADAGAETFPSPQPITREQSSDGADFTEAVAGRAGRPGGLMAGQVIAGRYMLLEILGEGGMGTVYLAEQSAPVRRMVALKLIKIGMDSRVVLARFDAERQALALMDHANIARVYDGGTTEAGQPFFVMELVRGEPITDYCDRRRLSVRARLELFVLVCQAVQHAHQKGIIHRDLKPSNVMVTEADGRATPKVIDFGVAKATELKLTDQSLGDTGAVVGTPTYMSPEQADPSSMDIDTRTDVYALGVILYELLAGSPPIDAKQFKRGAILEMLRMVREVDPPRPSTKVSTADALPSISANRDVEPAHLKRALRGDLDWIVMMALEKDRSRRYESANGFAADILRHLAHEPVVAAPPSRAYRLRKFVRKHRGAVTAASLVLFALLAGMAGTTWGLFEAKRQEAAANHYADKAKAQARVASDNAKRADAEARSARKAEQEAKDRAAAEAAAKALAQQETERADAEKRRTQEQLTRAEWLLYAGKLMMAQNNFESGDGALALRYLDECQWNLRGWEHRYLWSRISARQTLVGHGYLVWSAAFSADGKRILTGSWDKTAKVWDAATGQEILTLNGNNCWVLSAAFSPDGKRIVTGGGEFGYEGIKPTSEAKVWDAATGRQLFGISGHQSPVWSVAFSPDGKRILSGSRGGRVSVSDAATGQELLVLKCEDELASVAFSPDGKRIAAGGATVKVWDAATGQELLTFKRHGGAVFGVAYSPDGKRIATASEDFTVKVSDAATGHELVALKGHAAQVFGVAFSPDGRRIVSGSYDKTVRVWDAATGQELHVLKGHAGLVRRVAFSPDGRRIVSGSDDKTAKVWDAEKGQELPTFKGHHDFVRSIAYRPDGNRIVTGSGDKTAKVWDAATRQEVLTLKGHTSVLWSVAYSPDGKRIATASKDRTARVWDAATGQEVLALKGHTDEVLSVAFSADGKRIVTGSTDMTVRVWDAETGGEDRVLKGHTNVVYGVAYSPDGKRIASASVDGTARVWDAEAGRELLILKGHTGWVLCVAFSPDGKRIATGSIDQTARVWDVETGQEVLTLRGHTALLWSVAFSPDGQRIATGSGDKTARVWDAATGQEVLALRGHAEDVLCVAFSPDSKRILSGIGGIHSTVTIWNAEREQDVLVLKGHTDVVTNVAFSPDGKRIFAWDAQKRVLAWTAADAKPIAPIDPPPVPPPGPASSPDGFRHAVTQGKTIAVTDNRPPPQDNAWPLPVAAERKRTATEQAAPAAREK
jgi:WD40 repeat protein/serine/threonine protein kinase